MFNQTDAQYFRMRSDEERELSRGAADPRVADAHAEMADRYAQMATGLQLMRTAPNLVD